MAERTGVLPWHRHAGAFDIASVRDEDVAPEQLLFLQANESMRNPFNGLKARWQHIRQRLLGLTESDVLCRDQRAVVSVLRLYRPPGGSATISYRRSADTEGGGEFTLFGVGFGAGGSVDLSSVLDFTADETDLELLLHLPVTVTRRWNLRTGISLLQIDLAGDERSVGYELRSFADSDSSFDPDNYDRLDWQVLKTILLAGSSSSEMVRWTYPDVRCETYWHGSLDARLLPVPDTSIKIGIRCRTTVAHSASFSLPHGQNYVFYAPAGETVLAPRCAALAPAEP